MIKTSRFLATFLWMALMYVGTLYIAVGSLGVSEITRQFGDQAAYIFHKVAILNSVHQQERGEYREKRILIQINTTSQDAANGSLRAFGIEQGLALEKIQPIIDDYKTAPRLGDLLNKPLEMAIEKEWAKRMAQVMNLQAERKALEFQAQELLNDIKSDWASQIKVEGADTGDIEMAATTASALERMGYGWLFSMPSVILTLVLALSMGALGSTLQITKSVLVDEQQHSYSYYVVRPFQGMVTALVIFVLLKSGQMTISAGSADDLNNYFVALIGVVSGLMSLQAYHLIENAGSSILKVEAQDDRWAFRLRETLTQQNVNPQDLAKDLNIPPETLTCWLDEKQPVPTLEQKLIAAWLHCSSRALFTSQPPEEPLSS